MSLMSEILVAYSPINTQQVLELTNVSLMFFLGGGVDSKWRIRGTKFVDGKEVPAAYIKRACIAQGQQEITYENWFAFKAAYLPVPEEMWLTEDGILVSDVTVDGSEVYGKSLSDILTGKRREVGNSIREKHPCDVVFAKINKQSLRERAHYWAEVATGYGLCLPDDDPIEIIVHPDSTWDIIILDLFHAETPRTRRMDIHALRDYNIRKVNATIDGSITKLQHLFAEAH